MTEYPYHDGHSVWEKCEILTADLGPRLSMSDFSRKFRSEEPRLLAYEIDQLGWRGFVACAPWNTAFAALDVLARILSPSLIRYGEKLADEALTYKGFESAIRRANIKKDDVPRSLFWPYAGFGAYVKGTKKSFGTKAPSLDYLRVAGWLVTLDAAAQFENLLDEVIRTAGEWGFCRADERPNKVLPQNLDDVSSLICAPIYIPNEDPSLRTSRLAGLSSALAVTTARLSDRKDTSFDVTYHEIARPRLDLFANASGFGQEPYFDELTEEVILKKVLLTQELEWPTFYSSLADSLGCYESEHFVGTRYDRVREVLRNALEKLRSRHNWIAKVEELAGALEAWS